MSISAPPGRPSISETLTGAFRDGLPLTKTNAVPVLVLIGATVVLAILLVATGTMKAISSAANLTGAPGMTVTTNVTMPPAGWVLMAIAYVMIFVVSYYALAAGVRTIHPDFRMTVGRFFGSIGYTLLAMLLIMVAGIFLIIPAYWVGVKVLLMPYTYLLDGSEGGVLQKTWNMTTGYYWQTVGMLLLAGVCVGVITEAAFYLCASLAGLVPVLAVIFMPLAMAVLIWTMHVSALVYVRWTAGLLPRAHVPHGAVPATA